MVWGGERQLQVVTQVKSFKEPRLVPPVLELVLMKRGDVMIVQGWTYDCFLPYALMRWWVGVVLCCGVSSLTIRFLSSDWQFLGGLAFTGLGTTEVLSTCQHPRQLLGPHIKPLACLLGRPLIEVFPQHLQPYCCRQNAGGAISRFMGPDRGCWGWAGPSFSPSLSFLLLTFWPTCPLLGLGTPPGCSVVPTVSRPHLWWTTGWPCPSPLLRHWHLHRLWPNAHEPVPHAWICLLWMQSLWPVWPSQVAVSWTPDQSAILRRDPPPWLPLFAGVVANTLQWGPLWFGGRHLHQRPPLFPTASQLSSWNFWLFGPKLSSYLHGLMLKGGQTHCWSFLHIILPPLGSGPSFRPLFFLFFH